MPHKKNPDVWELIRSHSNRIATLPIEISMMIHNLPAGYHRDFQLLKEVVFPKIQSLKSILDVARYMLENIIVHTDLVHQEKYQYLFTVEQVNKLVLDGIPFRDAYKKVGLDVEQGNYQADYSIHHTHEGSIGNLCLPEIQAKMESILYSFDFEGVEEKLKLLLR